MSLRVVNFERVLDFFDQAPLRVAQAAVRSALDIVGKREESDSRTPAPVVVRKRAGRKSKANAAATTTAGTPIHGETLADA